MGHNSERTTEIYLKSLECNVINKTNHDLLNNVFRKTIKRKKVKKVYKWTRVSLLRRDIVIRAQRYK